MINSTIKNNNKRRKMRFKSAYTRGSYRGIFVMCDQIISFTEKRDLNVIRDAHVSRDM